MLLAPDVFPGMSMVSWRRWLPLVLVWAVPVSVWAQDGPSRREVIDRATAWTVRFGQELQGVVARERYVQTVRPWMGTPPERPGEVPASESRRLDSSLLLVHDPATPWQLHRDVQSVDGVDVPDRQDRLAALFADRSADPRQRLREITDDSARFNLGHVTRNINVPTFPLLVVHPDYRDRFRFRDRGRTREDDVEVRLIAYEETRRPRIVRGDRRRDVVLEGLLVIEEATGAFVRAIVRPRAGDLRSRLEVWFGRVPGLPMRVPVRFWEWYWVHDVPERDRYIEGEAIYEDFRRYTTEVWAPRVQ